MKKEIKDISWNVDEPTYRQDEALSYSTLSTYEKTGFDGLDHLFDKKETPALLLGSLVDALITEGENEFNKKYLVLDVNVTDGGKDVCNKLLEMNIQYDYFEQIPEELVSYAAKEAGFWKADKWDKIRYREVLKTGNIVEYFNALKNNTRTIVDSATYNDALAMVGALRESPSTAHYFAQDDPFSPIKRYYQLKFKTTIHHVKYRCMADLLIVDEENKTVYPVDLKTSGKSEWNFEDSFTYWNYMIQARLYWRIIRDCMNKDDYFKDFTLQDYRFIVVNKTTLTPLVWVFPLTQSYGTLIDDKGNKYRDPFEIGEELQGYLNLKPAVPNGINKNGINTINCLQVC